MRRKRNFLKYIKNYMYKWAIPWKHIESCTRSYKHSKDGESNYEVEVISKKQLGAYLDVNLMSDGFWFEDSIKKSIIKRYFNIFLEDYIIFPVSLEYRSYGISLKSVSFIPRHPDVDSGMGYVTTPIFDTNSEMIEFDKNYKGERG